MRPSKTEKLRIFVTGATGPYGAHFAQKCLEEGHEVFSLEHYRRPSDSASLLGIRDKITWVNGDIRDGSLLQKCMADWNVQAVAHFAALPLVKTGMVIAEPIFDINTMGTVRVLDAAKALIRGGQNLNFLYVSTDKALGYAGDRPYTEDMVRKPEGLYEASKAAGELACESYRAQGHVPNLVISRSCNVVAEADMNWRLIPNTIRQFLCNVPAKIYTKGQYQREFIDVKDAVNAQYTLLLRADEKPELFHIGSGHQWTQEEAITYIHQTHFPDGTINRVDPPGFHRIEIPYQRLDSTKLREVHGWKEENTVEKAVDRVVGWWRERSELAPWSQL